MNDDAGRKKWKTEGRIYWAEGAAQDQVPTRRQDGFDMIISGLFFSDMAR